MNSPLHTVNNTHSFNFPDGVVELFAEKVASRGLCAQAQAESLKYKLLGGLAVRRACYGVLRFVMEQGAKGAEVIVSGKLRAQRAKSMKFSDGYMIKSGQAKRGASLFVCIGQLWCCMYIPLTVLRTQPLYCLPIFPCITEYVDYAVRHVLMRQGVLGVKVKIMLPYDPTVRVLFICVH